MLSQPSPELPPYRITLFYGPEPVEALPSHVACVFNVKKRSWKGGVQVAVEVNEAQTARASQALDFEAWLRKALASIAVAERPTYESRARELLIQGLCSLKLDLAIKAGIQQANSRIAADAFVNELNQAVEQQADRLKSQILAELDLAAP
ncbi:MAG: hypothetical protein EPO61_00225 [Nitrospirae bacterium]|nr:MAG: hypothetical protein EPO61_00225 [Nitrospirota bacterium]